MNILESKIMEDFKLDEINNLLKKDFFKVEMDKSTSESFFKEIKELFGKKKETKAVLGLDIYKYSKYEDEKQDLIPVILKKILAKSYEYYAKYEPTSNQRNSSLKTDFIDTGDGGYWFFENPLDALLFSMYVNAFIHLYNSFIIFPTIRKHVGMLTVRFAITFDEVFKIDNTSYGKAIINNARIMSKDKLNRLLIDNNTYEWFLKEINGVENLLNIGEFIYAKNGRIEDLKSNNIFTNEKENELIEKYKDSFFLGVGTEKDPNSEEYDDKSLVVLQLIRTVICQKLESITVKNEDFNVHNLFVQYCLVLNNDEEGKDSEKYYNESVTLSLGNLNTNGI